MSKGQDSVIDDERSTRVDAVHLEGPYDVTLTENGFQRSGGAGQERAVLMWCCDMKMPRWNGLEVLPRSCIAPTMPVVMVTAITEASRRAGDENGRGRLPDKPFDVDEIRLVVDRIIKEKAPNAKSAACARNCSRQQVREYRGQMAPRCKRCMTDPARVDTDTSILVLAKRDWQGVGRPAPALQQRAPDGPFIPVHCAASQ